MESIKFESVKTVKGNVGVSFSSQEAADFQSKMMDNNNCNDCYNCNECYNCNDCDSCSDCYNCYNCDSCNECYNCKNCNDCTDCTFVPRWDKTKATSLHSITGLTWPVTFSKTQMQIGCQSHSIEAWKGFSDKEIASMEIRASEFWENYKELIFSFIALTLQDKPD